MNTPDPAGAFLDGEPLQLIRLNMDENQVELEEKNLMRIEQNLCLTGADSVSIVSVMGTYRTGKSFLLDLLLRFLAQYAADQRLRVGERRGGGNQTKNKGTTLDEDKASNEPEYVDCEWRFGAGSNWPTPAWIVANGAVLEGHAQEA